MTDEDYRTERNCGISIRMKPIIYNLVGEGLIYFDLLIYYAVIMPNYFVNVCYHFCYSLGRICLFSGCKVKCLLYKVHEVNKLSLQYPFIITGNGSLSQDILRPVIHPVNLPGVIPRHVWM